MENSVVVLLPRLFACELRAGAIGVETDAAIAPTQRRRVVRQGGNSETGPLPVAAARGQRRGASFFHGSSPRLLSILAPPGG
eukprot:3667859-Pyramimonas_sp.AAC.1